MARGIEYTMKPLFFLTILFTVNLFADCKVVKKTYEVTEATKKCIYTSTWKSGWSNLKFHAKQVSMWISPDCNGFAKPLHGKVIKTEVLSETIDSSCSFKNPPAKTK